MIFSSLAGSGAYGNEIYEFTYPSDNQGGGGTGSSSTVPVTDNADHQFGYHLGNEIENQVVLLPHGDYGQLSYTNSRGLTKS